jgi:flagellar protein FlaJ
MRLFYELYQQSGLAFSYRRYMAALVPVPLAAGTAAGVAGLLLMGPLAGAAFGLMASFLAFAGLVLYPFHLAATRRSHFENNFVYTLAVLLSLLAAGVPLGRAVARLAEVEEDKYIAGELALAVREMIVMGVTPEEALRNSAERTPSPAYREMVEVLIKASRITQRVDVVLLARLDWMLRAKQVKAQSLVRSLSLMLRSCSCSDVAPHRGVYRGAVLQPPRRLRGGRPCRRSPDAHDAIGSRLCANSGVNLLHNFLTL